MNLKKPLFRRKIGDHAYIKYIFTEYVKTQYLNNITITLFHNTST